MDQSISITQNGKIYMEMQSTKRQTETVIIRVGSTTTQTRTRGLASVSAYVEVVVGVVPVQEPLHLVTVVAVVVTLGATA